MTTPTLEATQIPDEVMQAAREAAAKVWGSDTGSEELAAEFRRGMRDDSGSVETAVVAILTERDRCNAIVRAAWGQNVSIEAFETVMKTEAIVAANTPNPSTTLPPLSVDAGMVTFMSACVGEGSV